MLLEDAEGAMWTTAMLEALHLDKAPDLDRIVVSVDPPASGNEASDSCGIIVAGARMTGQPQDWTAYVLEDATLQGASPRGWAEAALAAMARHGADRLVAEVNQGGDMVESVVRQVDPMAPFRAVRASRGKAARAEPVAALYEQGRVKHVRGLSTLEEQMCQMTVRGYEGPGSPDRVDALVWALQELIIDPAAQFRRPRIRGL